MLGGDRRQPLPRAAEGGCAAEDRTCHERVCGARSEAFVCDSASSSLSLCSASRQTPPHQAQPLGLPKPAPSGSGMPREAFVILEQTPRRPGPRSEASEALRGLSELGPHLWSCSPGPGRPGPHEHLSILVPRGMGRDWGATCVTLGGRNKKTAVQLQGPRGGEGSQVFLSSVSRG